MNKTEEKNIPALLRRSDVQKITGLPTSTLYRDMARGDFPRPVLLTGRSVAWRSTDIDLWVEDRVVASGGYQKRKGVSK